MSRIRSQLDSILRGNETHNQASGQVSVDAFAHAQPRRVYEPSHVSPAQAYAQQQPIQQQPSLRNSSLPQREMRNPQAPRTDVAAMTSRRDFETLQSSLNQLAQKINSLGRPVEQPDRKNDMAMQGQNELLKEMRTGFQSVTQQLQSVGPRDTQHVDAELKRIADGIAALQENRSMHPDYIVEIQNELATLHSGIEHLLQKPETHFDMSGVSRSIESGYADIASRLDHLTANQSQASFSAADLNLPDYGPRLDFLSTRLEEVTRAVMTLSVSPDGGDDVLAFERIEARLASLAKAVDHIAEHEPVTDDSALKAIASQISELSLRINDTGHVDTIASQIALLSEKLDNLQGMDAAGSQIFADVQGLASRLENLQDGIGIIASSLDEMSAGDLQAKAVIDPTAFSGIENQLADLAGRIDALAGSTQSSGDVSSNDQSEEILYHLRDLVSRIQTMETSSPIATPLNVASGFDDERFGALEIQLSNIASQLGSVEPSSFDYSPLSERLDQIENQIAASRDIIIDIATEAAQRSVPQQDTEQLSHQSDGALEEILQELRQLRQNGLATTGVDSSITASLAEISQRISQLTDQIGTVETANYGYEEGRYASAPTMQAADHNDTYELAPEHAADINHGEMTLDSRFDEPASAYSQTSSKASSHVSVLEDDQFEENREYAAEYHEAPALDMSRETQYGAMDTEEYTNEAPQLDPNAPQNVAPEVEDVPLAPGSGMPDLEALVRRATQRKKENPSPEAQESNISDLMAAARRAAQAAAVNTKKEASEPKAKKLNAKLPPVKMPAFVNRKFALMSTAAVAIALGGIFIAPKLMGGSTQTSMGGSASDVAATGVDTEADTQAEIVQDKNAASDNLANQGSTENQGTVSSDEQANPEGSSLLSDSSSAIANSANGFAKKADDAADALVNSDTSAAKADTEFSKSASLSIEVPAEVKNAALIAAAKSGDADALFEIGRRYTDGDGLDRSLETAISWYEKAAAQGSIPAQYRLGNFYEKGHGVTADPVKAAQWYEQAATGGNALAMHNLAVLNAMGLIGGDADMTTAIGWFEKAANMGVKDSQVNLGILYTKGMGVEENLEEAYKWFAIAAKGGDADAVKKRDTVAQALRPEQLEKARATAEGWKPEKLVESANIAKVLEEWKSPGSVGPSTKGPTQEQIVRQTQLLLNKAGFDAGAPDGKFGERTRRAIEAFQQKTGIPADGRITPDLLKALTGASA